jgi:hypothetical protein
LALPPGFHDRLRRRLDQRPSLGSEERVHASRRAVLAWALTAAAAVPLSFALFFAKRTILPRLGHQTPWGSPDAPAVTGLVAVSQDAGDMVFHIPGCSHLHGKPKFLQVEEAIREAYSPCPICIGRYAREKKRLARSEHASLHARAHSLAGSPVPDYDVRERVSVRYNSLRSTRTETLQSAGHLNYQRAHPKGAIPFSPVRV